MSLLTLFQNTTGVLGYPEPNSVIGSSDKTTKQLLRTLDDVGDIIRESHRWPELTKEHQITLVANQADYAFPADFDWQVFETHWAQTEQWPLIGPITPQEWRARKDGIITSSPRQRFRVRDYDLRQFYIDPTPEAGDAGNTIIFEYQSKTWFLPQQWVTGTVYNAGDYVSYNANVYSTTAGGTSGATPPTHTSGDASDGGVTWTFQSDPYDTLLFDTDIFNIDEKLISYGLKWFFQEQKGLPHDHYRQRFLEQLKRKSSSKRGAKTLNLAQRSATRLLSAENVPDTGYGA